MNNKKTILIVISAMLGVILVISLAVGLAFALGKSNNKASSRKKEPRKISREAKENEPEPTQKPTPMPTPTVEPTPTPEVTPEPVDTKTELLDKLVGVWGVPGGGFMQFYDTGEIYSGWFESERKPLQHILEVEKIGEDKYELLIKEDEWEYDGVTFEASTSKFIYDGSIDGFEKVLHLSNDYAEEYLLRIGDTFEEAETYSVFYLDEEYEKFEREILKK